MYKNLSLIICSAVILLLMESCITEDRYVCPSYLTIDMSQINRDVVNAHIWFFDPFGKLLRKDTISRSMFSKPYEIEITREDYASCYMWGNIGKNTLLNEEYSLNTSLRKKDNLPADSLYSYSCELNTNAESSYIRLKANKEYATVDVVCAGYCDTTAFNINVELECRNRGFYVNKNFIENTTTVKTRLCELGLDYSMFTARILRQGDVNDIKLIMNISQKGNLAESSKKDISADIPIGKYLSENGYNMLAEDLSDISITVDLVGCFIYIKAEDWVYEKKFKVEF